MDHFSRLNRAGMFFHRCLIPVMLIACFFVRTIHSIQRCGRDLCRDDQICCAQGNDTTVTCCKQLLDKTYYNIAMVTRKLSGVLILLLLFAVGYFIHRALCSKSRQLTPPPNGQPTVTTSQEPLVERCCTPKNFTDPGAAAQLPTYEECKRLPTYEETVREGSSGQLESSI